MSAIVDKHFPNPLARHDWSSWEDGQIHELTRGVDFPEDTKHFRRLAYRRAEARQLYARTSARGDVVRLQFLPREQG